MAAVESEADDKFANVDVDSILSRVGRRPLTFGKTRSIYKAPEFLKRLTGEETVNEGTTVQLETKVCGFPRPVLRWYKDDEEVVDHPRIHVESNGDGVFVFTLENVNKGDEAAYRCRAENEEGVSSSCFYLHVKAKPRSPKRSGKTPAKRSVSYPPMFPTIIEKVEEEEKEAKETARSPPSPLTQLYDGLTLQTRHTWPKFLGDWAYVDNVHRNGGSIGSESDSETGDGHSLESADQDEVFSDEKSHDVDSASFYLSSSGEGTPGTPECQRGDMKDDSLNSVETNTISDDAQNDVTENDKNGGDKNSGINGNVVRSKPAHVCAKTEQNNNEPKASKGNRDLHLPLTNGLVSNECIDEKKEDKENVMIEKIVKKKKEKDSIIKKNEEKKKSGEKIKMPKKEEKDKSVKKTEKEKSVKKIDSKEKPAKKEGSGVKTADPKDETVVKKVDAKEETKSKLKSKDVSKSPTEKKPLKKTDSKQKKTDSPKRKSESKESKKRKSDYINNPDPPILGSARPLVFTNFSSQSATYSFTNKSDTESNNEPDNTAICAKVSVQSEERLQREGINGDVVCSHEKSDFAIVPPPVGDVPFGRYFEDFIFVVCLFTFLALCIGIPTETFVLVILGMHFFYSMATILGFC